MTVRTARTQHTDDSHAGFDPAGAGGDAPSLQGSRVAFTGRLATMTQARAHELVRDAGGIATSSVSRRTSLLVVGMHGLPLRRDGGVSVKLRQAERLRARFGHLRIVSERRFLELLGLRETEQSALDKTYTIDQVSRLVNIDPMTLSRWEYLGLVQSIDGRYDFQDIVSLQTIASIVRDGVDPREIQLSIESLASIVPNTERPLAQLRIIASDSGELAAQIGETLIAPDGQQLLDFDRSDPDGDPVRAESSIAGHRRAMIEAKPAATADSLIDAALHLEDEEAFDEAAGLYRTAIAREPGRIEAYFNLGNALRLAGRAQAAEEVYRIALAIDPTSELAWYNLADTLEEDDRCDEAAECLRRAVELCPTFADGHFNLAACLEELGRRDEACEHWRAYLRLDPHGSEWAAIARRYLATSARPRDP